MNLNALLALAAETVHVWPLFLLAGLLALGYDLLRRQRRRQVKIAGQSAA